VLEEAVGRDPSAENYLDLSLAYYRAGRYGDCIDAGQKALLIRPDYPEVYNNICVAHIKLGQFESAMAACKKALEISPGYELAKNNLAWATMEKERAAK
jgi:tetratricopeptide (TPR) repeat protein